MYNLRAKMFNKRACGPKSKPDEIIKALSLEKGQKVSDVGVGGGYFSLYFAELVGKGGKVYAIDTNRNFLDFLSGNADERGFENVITILADNEGFPAGCGDCDLVFMRNVYHHIPDREDYLRTMKEILKPGGMVVVIDYKDNGSFSFHRLFGHNVPRQQIISELDNAGYRLVDEYDFLPEQNFLVFKVHD
ncbi:MAG: methyltransferase domain-containing protein [Euryarchaeota archaeon]|nr:methyltransferase domain-containing protein [Euryarchaeota archaeon]